MCFKTTSFRDLSMGFVGGVTGVVTKPYEGAKETGVGGFFKGVGKGVAGLVTRPTGGIVDFASGTFDTVKRAAEVGDEFKRVRPARLDDISILVIRVSCGCNNLHVKHLIYTILDILFSRVDMLFLLY